MKFLRKLDNINEIFIDFKDYNENIRYTIHSGALTDMYLHHWLSFFIRKNETTTRYFSIGLAGMPVVNSVIYRETVEETPFINRLNTLYQNDNEMKMATNKIIQNHNNRLVNIKYTDTQLLTLNDIHQDARAESTGKSSSKKWY